MAYTDITALPTAPLRSDTPDDFVSKADAWVDSLATFVTETNLGGGELNSISTQVTADLGTTNTNATTTADNLVLTNADVLHSSEWAKNAEDSPVSVNAGGDGATTYSSKHQAIKSEASHQGALVAAAAAGSASGLPTLTGNAGKALVVNSTNDGVVWEDLDTNSLKSNVAINAFNIAVNGGMTVQNMVDGVSDSFVDETGISTSTTGAILLDGAYEGMIEDSGFDISSNISYSGESFLLSGQDASTRSVVFNEDGTKFFGVGGANDRIYEYTCSIAFDLGSTVLYSGNSFYVGSQESQPNSISFNSDGTKIFVLGENTNTVYEYTASVGFDLSSTVVYSGNSFNVSSEIAGSQSIQFNNDGTKFFIAAYSQDTVCEYTVSVGFDLGSNVSYSGYNFSPGLLTLRSIAFNKGGDKIFCVSNSDDKVYEYILSKRFSFSSSIAYSGSSFDIISQDGNATSISFNNNGSKFYIFGTNTQKAYEYNCPNITRYGSPEISLHTETFTALSDPSTALVVIQEEDVDSVTLNTDLSAWVSKNAVSTYTTLAATDNKLRVVSHGFSDGDRVILSTPTGGNFPTGLDGITAYYVVNSSANDFEVSLTSGGSAVVISVDNGGVQNVSDYSQATLIEETTTTVGRILTGEADLSSQATGTEISTVILTDNSKALKIHALSTQWSD